MNISKQRSYESLFIKTKKVNELKEFIDTVVSHNKLECLFRENI